MARFLHIADAQNAKHIRRSGLLAPQVWPGLRAVFCVPVIPDLAKTYQWARELRMGGARSMVAVFFDVPDAEPVLIGRFKTAHMRVSAVEAHAAFRAAAGPIGQEILLPRRVDPDEIRGIKPAPRLMGWRFYPEAKGREPFYPYRGSIGANRQRELFEKKMSQPWSGSRP